MENDIEWPWMANMAEAFRNSKSNAAAKGLCNDPVEGDPQQFFFRKKITKVQSLQHMEKWEHMKTYYENMLNCHLLKSVEICWSCSENLWNWWTNVETYVNQAGNQAACIETASCYPWPGSHPSSWFDGFVALGAPRNTWRRPKRGSRWEWKSHTAESWRCAWRESARGIPRYFPIPPSPQKGALITH